MAAPQQGDPLRAVGRQPSQCAEPDESRTPCVVEQHVARGESRVHEPVARQLRDGDHDGREDGDRLTGTQRALGEDPRERGTAEALDHEAASAVVERRDVEERGQRARGIRRHRLHLGGDRSPPARRRRRRGARRARGARRRRAAPPSPRHDVAPRGGRRSGARGRRRRRGTRRPARPRRSAAAADSRRACPRATAAALRRRARTTRRWARRGRRLMRPCSSGARTRRRSVRVEVAAARRRPRVWRTSRRNCADGVARGIRART